MRFSDQWNRLVSIPAWTPIEDFPFVTSHVEDNLYRLADQVFMLAVDRGADLRPSPTPRVTMAVWAVDVGVARRFLLRQIENDSGNSVALPPQELLSPPATYQSILDRCDDRTGSTVMLVAEYRIAQDGAAIGGLIRHRAREYCFRSVNPAKDDPVVAIKLRLPWSGYQRVAAAHQDNGA